jgi:predicted nucleotidyltransferase
VIAATRSAVAALAGLGVRALVTGSLARGGFGPASDVDLLVTACPRQLKYAIEGIVEDALGGIPFDVVYLDEVPAWKVSAFTQGAVDASELR